MCVSSDCMRGLLLRRWLRQPKPRRGPISDHNSRRPALLGHLVKCRDQLWSEFAIRNKGKGRVERLWGTFQDRLTSELRLVGAASLEDANQVLARFLPKHNRLFAIPPAEPEPAWRAVPKDLDRFFCFKFSRRVAADHTIRFDGRQLDLEPSRTSYAGRLVEVQERFDGTLHIYAGERRLARLRIGDDSLLRLRNRTDLSRRPDLLPPPAARPTTTPPTSPNRSRPAANHPWRRPFSPAGGQIR